MAFYLYYFRFRAGYDLPAAIGNSDATGSTESINETRAG
jgi:hypothetical protein